MRDEYNKEVQIGGLLFQWETDYWSNPNKVQRSPKETCELIDRLLGEVNSLRLDAIAQILDFFRKHPSRKYGFEFPSYARYDPEIAADMMKEDFHNGSGYRIKFSPKWKQKYEELCEDVYEVFVDSDGIIKISLMNSSYPAVELGDVRSGVEDILRFICDARDKALCSDEDLEYGGVFYTETTS